MAIKTQNWYPDTCPSPPCCIEQTHNPDDPDYGVQFSRVIRKCSAHVDILNDDLWGVLYANPDGENKRKNLIEKHLLENEALALSETVDGVTKWKAGLSLSWSFNTDRVLEISIVGANMTASQKDLVQEFALDIFGSSKVTVL